MKNLARTLRRSLTLAATAALLASVSVTAGASERTLFYHADALGSPVAATDESGYVLWRESYRPYGERLVRSPPEASNARYYTGHPHDDTTGLTYTGARYYDPVLGRFYGVDPKSFSEGDPYSFNRYAYANNNPYAYTDPDGRSPWLLRLEYTIVYEGASVLGARALGSAIGIGIYNILHNESSNNDGTKGASSPATPQAEKPKGVPDHWVEGSTDKGGGREWVNPDNDGDRVRSYPGNPNSSNPGQREPYVKDVRSGNQWLDKNGDRIEGKEGKMSPDTHIPVEDYQFPE